MASSIRKFFDKAPEGERPTVAYAETSGNFDMDEVQPFLEHLHAFGVPLGRLDFIADTIGKFPEGKTYDFECVGASDDQLALVTIRAFVADTHAVDLTFIGPEPVIGALDALLLKRC